MYGVTAEDCAEVRRRVAEAADQAGLPQERAVRFVVAVNEIVINAVQHGGGEAEVTITLQGDGVVVEVRDYGPGITGHAAVELPAPEQIHGRGLWLAHQLCDDVTVRSVDIGALVRLSAAVNRP
jgi:anti-sigma regulatory factor (Ser/Thr protein kinase)